MSSRLSKPDLLRRKGEEPSPEHNPLDAACFGFLAGYVNGNTKVRFDTFGGMMTGNTINFAIRLQTGQFAFAAATASLLFSFVLGAHARLEALQVPIAAAGPLGHSCAHRVVPRLLSHSIVAPGCGAGGLMTLYGVNKMGHKGKILFPPLLLAGVLVLCDALQAQYPHGDEPGARKWVSAAISSLCAFAMGGRIKSRRDLASAPPLPRSSRVSSAHSNRELP